MPNFKITVKIAIVAVNFLFVNSFVKAQTLVTPPFKPAYWSYPYQPFRIAGNLYYVGTYDLACYLITTPQGNILINTGVAPVTEMIRDHIEQLGFKFSDIKILLATHAHWDHVAGMADIKKETNAKIWINEHDAPVLADGGASDYVFGSKGPTFKAVKADRILHEHDTIKLGGMKIVALHTPGHTLGANSFLFDVKDDKRTYRVFIANMPTVYDDANLHGMATYPDIDKDYKYTFDLLKKQQFDLFLSSHAEQFKMHEKHKPGDPYNPDVFIDRTGYDDVIANFERLYQQKFGQR
ncbi:subclass B3 metallo-beta-lactamase [Mucilaginibacter sp. HD30]